MKIKIFKSNREIDLSTFIDSRALITANSGGGKSYAIRKILEESNDSVMAIILDVEGEFKTLREKFHFLLIGQSGDIPLSMKSVSLLPKKLLEHNASTIIDISDLKMNERIQYAKKFLEALMEVPREFWKPCIVVLDEAHLLAGQQEKQDSTHAVIDLMTRGRKRGFCGVLCSQRISKLHKDAVAEANNYLVGRTGLDIDMKRASEILGFTSKEQMLSLRDLAPGEFYVFGTALSRGVEKEFVGSVRTTHPKVGMDIRKNIIEPTEKVAKIISKLNDLPQEQERNLKEVSDYKKRINELEFLLKKNENNFNKKEILKEEYNKQIESARLRGYSEGAKDIERSHQEISKRYSHKIKQLENKIVEAAKVLNRDLVIKENHNSTKLKFGGKLNPTKEIGVGHAVNHVRQNEDTSATKQITGGAMRILKASAMFYPNFITKQRAGAIAGLSYKSGSFNTYISNLKREGLIDTRGNEFIATDLGLQNAGDFDSLPENLIEMWCNIMKGGASRMLKYLGEIYPQAVSKSELAEATGLSHNSGSFNTYISTLKRNGLIKINHLTISASEELFP